MERNVCVIAGGMSKWGVREGSQRDFFQEAAKACYNDNPQLNPKDIDGLLVASAYTERTSYQTHLAPLVAEYVGIKPKNICARVELLCASGSSAIILAFGLIKVRTSGHRNGSGWRKTLHAAEMGSFLQRTGFSRSRLGRRAGLGSSAARVRNGGQAAHETVRNQERASGSNFSEESSQFGNESPGPIPDACDHGRSYERPR